MDFQSFLKKKKCTKARKSRTCCCALARSDWLITHNTNSRGMPGSDTTAWLFGLHDVEVAPEATSKRWTVLAYAL